MQRILIIGEDPAVGVSISPQLQACSIEIADGDAEALQRLRQRAFELVLTDPKSSVQEDLALVNEIENIRPGVKTINVFANSGYTDRLVTYSRVTGN